MKRLYKIVVIMLLLVPMVLTGCGKKELSDKLVVATLNGPTGMGLVDLKDEESIDLQIYQAPDEAAQKLISGDVDVACLPSNMGAVLNAKTKGQVQVLTTVVKGVLYLAQNGSEGSVNKIADLKGKTVYASGKGGTPEYVLQTLLKAEGLKLGEDVQVKWMDAHADVAQQLMANEGSIAMLPEPFLTSASVKNKKIRLAVDINEAWQMATGQELPMGILVARKELVENRPEDVALLLELVKASTEDVNSASDEVVKKIVDAGFVTDAELCKVIIPRCAINCMSPKDSKQALKIFYKKLYEANPASVGGKLPKNSLYYISE